MTPSLKRPNGRLPAPIQDPWQSPRTPALVDQNARFASYRVVLEKREYPRVYAFGISAPKLFGAGIVGVGSGLTAIFSIMADEFRLVPPAIGMTFVSIAVYAKFIHRPLFDRSAVAEEVVKERKSNPKP